MNRQRDKLGRFRSIADDIIGLFDLFVLAVKLFLIGFLLYAINQYVGVDEIIKNHIIKVLFGSTCKVTCAKNEGGNGGYFSN